MADALICGGGSAGIGGFGYELLASAKLNEMAKYIELNVRNIDLSKYDKLYLAIFISSFPNVTNAEYQTGIRAEFDVMREDATLYDGIVFSSGLLNSGGLVRMEIDKVRNEEYFGTYLQFTTNGSTKTSDYQVHVNGLPSSRICITGYRNGKYQDIGVGSKAFLYGAKYEEV